MEENETLPKSGEQVLSSSGEEVPVPSTSAEERTCPFDKQRGMTCPFDEHQGIPVLTTSSDVVPVPSTSVVAEPVLSTSFVAKPITSKSSRRSQRVKCPVESSACSYADTAENSLTIAAVETVSSTSVVAEPILSTSFVVKPITSTRSSRSQRVKCPVESSACSYTDTAENYLTIAAVETVSSTSSEQRSSGHQPMFSFRENSDTDTADSPGSGDEIPLEIFRRKNIQIERVPRNFDVSRVSLRNRAELSIFSAETAKRIYHRHVHYNRKLSTSLDESVARNLAIPLAEDELHRRHSLENHLKAYYNFLDRWGRSYSRLIRNAQVQKNKLENLKNRLDVMMEGPINFFEADEIYNMIDDLETSLYFTKLLSEKIIYRIRYIAAFAKKIAIGGQ